MRREVMKLLMVLCGLVLLSGCLGSPRPRNPNKQRKDVVKKVVKKEKSLIGSRRSSNRTVPEAERIILDLPKNSWAQHDRDVHRVLEGEAQQHAPIYPWFKIEKKKKLKVPGG